MQAEDLHPRILGEFDDSALMNAVGQAGEVAFPAPAAIKDQVVRQYRVRAVARLTSVRERYYAISAERRLTHPGVLAITATARGEVFAP